MLVSSEAKAARRKALQDFLIQRRRRLTHDAVGIRGRAPIREGLSQADVAELAAVSLNWYQLFESGRGDRRVSVDFLERISSALRLENDDRLELFRLALPEAETFEQLKERAEDASVAVLRALPRLVRVALKAPAFRDTASLCAETLQSALNPDAVTLATLAEDGGVGGVGFGPRRDLLTAEMHQILWRTYSEMPRADVANVQRTRRHDGGLPEHLLDASSLLVVPIHDRRAVRALLSALWIAPRRFSRVEIETMRGIAAIAELILFQ